MNKFIVGVLQLDSQSDIEENLHMATALVKDAVAKGAQVIALPESMNYTGLDSLAHAENVPNGKSFRAMAALAKKYQVWIHCGSIYEKNPAGPRPYNCTMIINARGELVAKYHKLHPFDVVIDEGPVNKESDKICPGRKIVTLDTKEVGCWGLSICYDIRFPELFRLMALEGAQIFFTPANFTMPTGKDHWEAILRTRAIENGCYVVAPAQCGSKPNFQAYGNAMVIDPWGNVIARASNKPMAFTAEIDLDYVTQVRRQLCMLQNRRTDIYDLRKK